MREDFQWEVLKFLVQVKEGKKYFKHTDAGIFDLPQHEFVYDLVDEYVKEYGLQPSKVSLLEYFDGMSKKNKNLSSELYKVIEDTIYKLYQPFSEDRALIRDRIVRFAKYKKTKHVFGKYATKIKDDETVFSKVYTEISQIVKLGDDLGKDNENKGGMVIKDHNTRFFSYSEGYPTYLNSLNKMTAARGFHSPQLVVFMGAPKSFKTGNLLKMAVEYMRDGLKVYYVDCENGVKSIWARVHQTLLECERYELDQEGTKEDLNQIISKLKNLGGEMALDFYPAHTCTVADVEADLERLREEENWVPDVICWDYPDLMVPVDSRIIEKRLKIQAVYFDIIRLNSKWNVFSMALSQVKQAAVGREVIDMTAFAEDFGKAANCHAAFAICRTEAEMENGLARIIPVVQREGVPYAGANQCYVNIQAARMVIKEINRQQAQDLLGEEYGHHEDEQPKRRNGKNSNNSQTTVKIKPNKLKDE